MSVKSVRYASTTSQRDTGDSPVPDLPNKIINETLTILRYFDFMVLKIGVYYFFCLIKFTFASFNLGKLL